ncbi:hypothetical protein [Nocardia paucivorans]|uniref:hypothetical protein n=1 Tax=Nocardia paucivorans TaxID=114259 RepID=UPI001FE09784|nr:hypothetical protein [Nocardia paucivorans]
MITGLHRGPLEDPQRGTTVVHHGDSLGRGYLGRFDQGQRLGECPFGISSDGQATADTAARGRRGHRFTDPGPIDIRADGANRTHHGPTGMYGGRTGK